MAVSEEIEILIKRLSNFSQNFEVQRNGDVLNFIVKKDKENPWFSLQNITFDYDDTDAKISYILNDINYICNANIISDVSLDFGVGNLILDASKFSQSILKILVFILGFNNEFTLGRGLDLTSRNQRSINFMGLQIQFKINEE